MVRMRSAVQIRLSAPSKNSSTKVEEFFSWSYGLNVKGTLNGSFHTILLSEEYDMRVHADLIRAKARSMRGPGSPRNLFRGVLSAVQIRLSAWGKNSSTKVEEFFSWSYGLNVKGTLNGSFHTILLSEEYDMRVHADLIRARHIVFFARL